MRRKVTRREFISGAGMAAGLVILGGCGGTVGQSAVEEDTAAEKTLRIAMVPKFTSDPYFVAASEGAKEAAEKLGVDLAFNGPVDANVSAQSDIIDQFIQRQFDAITVSANDPDALVPVMKRAQDAGIKVSTFDADVNSDAREVFLNQATFEGMGKTMVDMMVEQAGPEGKFLVVTATLTAPNQNRWIEEMREYIDSEYPGMEITAKLPSNEKLDEARRVTLDYLRSHPDTDGVFAVTGIATPGVAEAVKQLGLKGEVAVTGLGVPSLVRKHIKDGTIKQVALWNPVDIGYGAVYMANAQLKGSLDPGSGSLKAGRLGELEFIEDDVLLLGPPLVFDKENIDDFDF